MRSMGSSTMQAHLEKESTEEQKISVEAGTLVDSCSYTPFVSDVLAHMTYANFGDPSRAAILSSFTSCLDAHAGIDEQ